MGKFKMGGSRYFIRFSGILLVEMKYWS